jgi:hypothetical protein
LYSVSENGDKVLLNTISDLNTTSYSISEFNPTHENWFWVRVNDFWGQSSIGVGMTNSIEPVPTSVDVNSVNYDFDEMIVSWDETSESYFLYYELHYAATELGDKSLLSSFHYPSSTSYNLTDFDPTHENWFWIEVVDKWGQGSVGNGMSNDIDAYPMPVDVTSVTYDNENMIIMWTQSEDGDFTSYELLQTTPTGGTESLTITEDVSDTSFTLDSFNPTIENEFQVRVTDYWGLHLLGNPLPNEIEPPPNPSDIISVEYNTENLTISWEQSEESDFLSYDLYGSASEGGDRILVESIVDIAVTEHSITEFDPTEENWFWVTVKDVWGQTTIGLGLTNSLELPPNAVTINPITYEDGNFNISWSQNQDNDFLSYSLYVSLDITMSESELIFSSGNQTDTNFIYPFATNEIRYYQLTTNDIYNLGAHSNIKVGNSYSRFNSFFGGSNTEIGRSVQLTSDGGFILGGYTRSFGNGGFDNWLVKTNSDGIEEWNQTYGGALDDDCHLVQQSSDGGYIMIGTSNEELWVVKTNSDGVEEWNQTYGGDGNAYGQSIQQTSDGGYIIIGSIYSTVNNNYNTWLIKTNSTGVEEWNQTYGGMESESGASVQLTSDDGFILAGYTYSFGNGGHDYWLVKTNSAGDEEWNQTYGGTSDEVGMSVQQTSDGGYIIAGITLSFSHGRNDYWLVKTNSAGDEEWNQVYGGGEEDVCYSVQQTSDDGYVMIGKTESFGNGNEDIWLVKTNSAGVEEWNQTYGGATYDVGYSVQQTLDDGFILMGTTDSFGNNRDYWLIKTDPYGNTTPF